MIVLQILGVIALFYLLTQVIFAVGKWVSPSLEDKAYQAHERGEITLDEYTEISNNIWNHKMEKHDEHR